MDDNYLSAQQNQAGPCHTIAEVVQALEAIVAQRDNGRMAWFAAVYLHMTKEVEKAIGNRFFEDNERMERLDVIFANRYLTAFTAYRNKQYAGAAWQLAFDNDQLPKLIVLQHILLGMNAHINYDLALAAAATVNEPDEIYSLQKDFDTINGLISSLADDIQERLTKLWWPMKAIARIANGHEKAVLNFSVAKARKASWANAVALAYLPGKEYHGYCNMLDQTVAAIGRKIISPDWMTRLLLRPVKMLEEKDLQKVTIILAENVV